MRFLRKFWRAILATGGLVGLYYLPIDIQGWRDAAPPWRLVLDMIERETLAVGLAVASLLYIIWMDFRPFFIRFMDESRRKFLKKAIGSVVCVFDLSPRAVKGVEQVRSLKISVQKNLYSAQVTNKTDKFLTGLKVLVSFKKEMKLSSGDEVWGTRPIVIGEIPQLAQGQSESLDLLGLLMKGGAANNSDSIMTYGGWFFPSHNDDETFTSLGMFELKFEFSHNGEIVGASFLHFEKGAVKPGRWSDPETPPDCYIPISSWLSNTRVLTDLISEPS